MHTLEMLNKPIRGYAHNRGFVKTIAMAAREQGSEAGRCRSSPAARVSYGAQLTMQYPQGFVFTNNN
jgi:hypothetical protein